MDRGAAVMVAGPVVAAAAEASGAAVGAAFRSIPMSAWEAWASIVNPWPAGVGGVLPVICFSMSARDKALDAGGIIFDPTTAPEGLFTTEPPATPPGGPICAALARASNVIFMP